MQGSGGFPPSRGHGTDRFYNPPAIRRQLQQQQQQQLQRQPPSPSMKPKPVAVSEVREAENRADSDESPSKPSVCSPPRTPSGNLDRFVEAMAPTVPAQYFSKVVGRWRKKVRVLMGVWFDLMGFVWKFLFLFLGLMFLLFLGNSCRRVCGDGEIAMGRINIRILILEIFGNRSRSGARTGLECGWCWTGAIRSFSTTFPTCLPSSYTRIRQSLLQG